MRSILQTLTGSSPHAPVLPQPSPLQPLPRALASPTPPSPPRTIRDSPQPHQSIPADTLAHVQHPNWDCESHLAVRRPIENQDGGRRRRRGRFRVLAAVGARRGRRKRIRRRHCHGSTRKTTDPNETMLRCAVDTRGNAPADLSPRGRVPQPRAPRGRARALGGGGKKKKSLPLSGPRAPRPPRGARCAPRSGRRVAQLASPPSFAHVGSDIARIGAARSPRVRSLGVPRSHGRGGLGPGARRGRSAGRSQPHALRPKPSRAWHLARRCATSGGVEKIGQRKRREEARRLLLFGIGARRGERGIEA